MSFTESTLVKKLLDLNNSQQSIQTLSLWLIHHRKHHANIVKTWYKELQKGMFIFIRDFVKLKINLTFFFVLFVFVAVWILVLLKISSTTRQEVNIYVPGE